MAGPMAILLGVVVALLGLPLILIAVLVVLLLRSRRQAEEPGVPKASPAAPPGGPQATAAPAKAKRGATAASRRRQVRPAGRRPGTARRRRES